MKKANYLQSIITVFIPLCFLLLIQFATNANGQEVNDKVLVVISADKHGYWLPEVLEPYRLLEKAGYKVDIASPQGNKGKASGSSRLSQLDESWFEDSSLMRKLKSPHGTKKHPF